MYGPDNALFGLPSGEPCFDRGGNGGNSGSGVEDADLKLDRLALRTFLKGSEYALVEVNIRSFGHFQAVACLGHIDLVFADGFVVSSVNPHRSCSNSNNARYATRDSVGAWNGPGLYLVANFPLRMSKPQAPSRNNPAGRQNGAGYSIKIAFLEQPRRRNRGKPKTAIRDIQPITRWLPSEKAWRKASAKEAFAQSIMPYEAAGLLDVLADRTCSGAGLWHFLATSEKPQRYAMSLLGFFEARDVRLLEETGTGKGKEVARVLAAALRKVIPPPVVSEGGTAREAMEALDVEVCVCGGGGEELSLKPYAGVLRLGLASRLCVCVSKVH